MGDVCSAASNAHPVGTRLVKILTGSSEFFGGGRDADYIVFRDQEPLFFYPMQRRPSAKPKGVDDCFYYRAGITKAQLFHWHRTENNWHLNSAPFVTRGFLEHLGIDIFDEDYDDVYWIMHKAFHLDYRLPSCPLYYKWLYRHYIYRCFIGNGELSLTDEQRQHAFAIYQQTYDKAVLLDLYAFFKVEDRETQRAMQQVFGGGGVLPWSL